MIDGSLEKGCALDPGQHGVQGDVPKTHAATLPQMPDFQTPEIIVLRAPE